MISRKFMKPPESLISRSGTGFAAEIAEKNNRGNIGYWRSISLIYREGMHFFPERSSSLYRLLVNLTVKAPVHNNVYNSFNLFQNKSAETIKIYKTLREGDRNNYIVPISARYSTISEKIINKNTAGAVIRELYQSNESKKEEHIVKQIGTTQTVSIAGENTRIVPTESFQPIEKMSYLNEWKQDEKNTKEVNQNSIDIIRTVKELNEKFRGSDSIDVDVKLGYERTGRKNKKTKIEERKNSTLVQPSETVINIEETDSVFRTISRSTVENHKSYADTSFTELNNWFLKNLYFTEKKYSAEKYLNQINTFINMYASENITERYYELNSRVIDEVNIYNNISHNSGKTLNSSYMQNKTSFFNSFMSVNDKRHYYEAEEVFTNNVQRPVNLYYRLINETITAKKAEAEKNLLGFSLKQQITNIFKNRFLEEQTPGIFNSNSYTSYFDLISTYNSAYKFAKTENNINKVKSSIYGAGSDKNHYRLDLMENDYINLFLNLYRKSSSTRLYEFIDKSQYRTLIDTVRILNTPMKLIPAAVGRNRELKESNENYYTYVSKLKIADSNINNIKYTSLSEKIIDIYRRAYENQEHVHQNGKISYDYVLKNSYISNAEIFTQVHDSMPSYVYDSEKAERAQSNDLPWVMYRADGMDTSYSKGNISYRDIIKAIYGGYAEGPEKASYYNMLNVLNSYNSAYVNSSYNSDTSAEVKNFRFNYFSNVMTLYTNNHEASAGVYSRKLDASGSAVYKTAMKYKIDINKSTSYRDLINSIGSIQGEKSEDASYYSILNGISISNNFYGYSNALSSKTVRNSAHKVYNYFKDVNKSARVLLPIQSGVTYTSENMYKNQRAIYIKNEIENKDSYVQSVVNVNSKADSWFTNKTLNSRRNLNFNLNEFMMPEIYESTLENNIYLSPVSLIKNRKISFYNDNILSQQAREELPLEATADTAVSPESAAAENVRNYYWNSYSIVRDNAAEVRNSFNASRYAAGNVMLRRIININQRNNLLTRNFPLIERLSFINTPRHGEVYSQPSFMNSEANIENIINAISNFNNTESKNINVILNTQNGSSYKTNNISGDIYNHIVSDVRVQKREAYDKPKNLYVSIIDKNQGYDKHKTINRLREDVLERQRLKLRDSVISEHTIEMHSINNEIIKNTGKAEEEYETGMDFSFYNSRLAAKPDDDVIEKHIESKIVEKIIDMDSLRSLSNQGQSNVDIEKITDRVYDELTRRLRNERYIRGIID